MLELGLPSAPVLMHMADSTIPVNLYQYNWYISWYIGVFWDGR
jgi:hypothetical protein